MSSISTIGSILSSEKVRCEYHSSSTDAANDILPLTSLCLPVRSPGADGTHTLTARHVKSLLDQIILNAPEE